MDKQVKISVGSHQTLIALAAKKDRSLKDFLEQCIQYFKVTELDPKELDSEGIKAEIKKLDRRIVSFFRTQEKDKIAPILDELSIISKTISENVNLSPNKKDLTAVATVVKESIQKIVDSQNALNRMTNETRLKEVSQLKHKARGFFAEYIQEVDNKSAMASRKPIDDKYKKLFETI